MNLMLPPYPKEAIRELAKEFGVSGCPELRRLWRFLRVARRIYEDKKEEPNAKVPARPVRRLLSSIERQAASLRDSLNKLDRDSSDPITRRAAKIFWHPEFEVARLAQDSHAYESPYGHHFWRIETSPGTYAIWWLDEYKIQNALDILAAYAKIGLERTAPADPGRLSDEALELWVLNMESYWTKVFRKRFTLQVNRGRVKSRPFTFCREALLAIDPSVTEQALVTAMRKVIRVRGQQRKTSS